MWNKQQWSQAEMEKFEKEKWAAHEEYWKDEMEAEERTFIHTLHLLKASCCTWRYL